VELYGLPSADVVADGDCTRVRVAADDIPDQEVTLLEVITVFVNHATQM
jgi:hypothetical protein